VVWCSWWEGECNGRILNLKIFRGRLPKKVKKERKREERISHSSSISSHPSLCESAPPHLPCPASFFFFSFVSSSCFFRVKGSPGAARRPNLMRVADPSPALLGTPSTPAKAGHLSLPPSWDSLCGPEGPRTSSQASTATSRHAPRRVRPLACLKVLQHLQGGQPAPSLPRTSGCL